MGVAENYPPWCAYIGHRGALEEKIGDGSAESGLLSGSPAIFIVAAEKT